MCALEFWPKAHEWKYQYPVINANMETEGKPSNLSMSQLEAATPGLKVVKKAPPTKTVLVHLKEQSKPVVVDDVLNTYTKGPFYCLYKFGGTVDKYPVADIFRVQEPY